MLSDAMVDVSSGGPERFWRFSKNPAESIWQTKGLRGGRRAERPRTANPVAQIDALRKIGFLEKFSRFVPYFRINEIRGAKGRTRANPQVESAKDEVCGLG